jgi:neutral ceramidase
MKKFKKIAWVLTGVFLGLFIMLSFLLSCKVDHIPYFKTSYYQSTKTRLDSLTKKLSSSKDFLEAGFSKVSITPSVGLDQDLPEEGRFKEVPLAGFGARKGKSAKGTHDSIFVKAAAIKVRDQLVVIVGADLLIMPPNIIDEVSSMLQKKGIHRHQVFYSASHTHSSVGAWGPGFIGEQFAGKANLGIQKWLVNQIFKAVTIAVTDLKPALIGNGYFNAAPYTRNRLIGETGTINHHFNYISIQQKSGLKAVIGSFGAHATTIGADNFEFSADYPGYWQRKMEQRSVDLAIFCGGSVGSQSPVGEGKEFEKSKYIGEALADSLEIHLAKVEHHDQLQLASMSLKMDLPDYHIRMSNRLHLTTWLSKKLMPLPENVYLQVIKMGNLLWFTTPSDFSGEFALQLKDALATKGFNANVTSFNGSYVGYIIPGKYFYFDSYEPKTMGWFGPNMGDYTFEMIRHLSDAMSQPNPKGGGFSSEN